MNERPRRLPYTARYRWDYRTHAWWLVWPAYTAQGPWPHLLQPTLIERRTGETDAEVRQRWLEQEARVIDDTLLYGHGSARLENGELVHVPYKEIHSA